MNKKVSTLMSVSTLLSGITVAQELTNDVYLFPALSHAGNVPVSTSMHDAGAASASYTLGKGGGNSVQTAGLNGAYTKEDESSASSGGSSSGSSRRKSSSSSSSSSAPSYAGAKDSKVVIPDPVVQSSPMIFTVEGGYQSDYVYRGLSQIGVATFDDETAGMYYAGVNAQWKCFTLALKYVISDTSDLRPNYDASQSTSYGEFVFDINYTLGLLAGPEGAGNWLDLTLGYQLQSFEEETFWNTDVQHTFHGQLKMNRYQWVRPSVKYYHMEQGDALVSGTSDPGRVVLEGDQVVVQVDGSGQIYDNGTVQVGLGYYAQVGWDDGYNYGSTSWDQSWYQVGLSLPVSYGNWAVIPTVNYTDSDVPSGEVGVDSPDFWWGVKAQYTF